MKDIFQTISGHQIDECYGTDKAGEYPFTRGIHKTMYRGRLWTMRQYAGFGSAREANARYQYLLEQGTTGLSIAFDLPTQMGRDSDHKISKGEVGRVGVAISSIEDMEMLLDNIPLERISISMTINATASILMAMLFVVAKRRGLTLDKIKGTIQNDILKEYIARGTYIFPPEQALRLVTDVFEFCSKEAPQFNTISISGYHIREAGSTAVQELSFTFANAIAYMEVAKAKGLDIDLIAQRIAFFFNCQIDFLEEISKFRAARRIWAKIMKERFNVTTQESMMLRFHTQTAGSSLTAQQPYNNIVRTTIEALSAVLGGTQSLHTNSFDEAIGLPTEESATVALRTQQIIAYESGVANSADPLGGSYLIERWTDEFEKLVFAKLKEIDSMGGMVKAIEHGFPQKEIESSAYEFQRKIESNERLVVGVNIAQGSGQSNLKIHKIDKKIEKEQVKRLKEFKKKRDKSIVKNSLKLLKKGVNKGQNSMPLIMDCIENGATLGEISDILRGELGEY